MAKGLGHVVPLLRTARLAGSLAVILSCMVAIILLGLDVRTRLDALERANSDNTQWVMMQAEVEVLRLQVAVEHGQGDISPQDRIATLAEVRRWFNVLYSRVAMLEESTIYRPLLQSPDYRDDHGRLRAFLEQTVPLIDGPDQTLLGALPALSRNLPAVRQAARSMTLNSLSDFAALSDAQRASISQTLQRLAVLTGALVVMLGTLALGMSRLYRVSESRAEKIRQTGARLSTMVANSADGIVVTDRNGIIEEFNPAAEAIFGLTRDQAVGRVARTLLFPPDIGAAQQSALAAALEEASDTGRGPLRIEVDGQRSDGATFPAEVSIATTRSADTALVVAFVRDISDRREADRRIEAALERAVAGEKTKAEFLAVMSHEMRTPLNGLIGSMVLMGDSALDDGQRKLLGIMRNSGDILLGHVNSVLDISRAEAGAIRTDDAPFDLDRLVADAVANQQGLATAGGNTIEVVQLTGPLGPVRGDQGRVRQILLNLIGNAVKFTRNGAIMVETERLAGRGGAAAAEMVEFRVIDTGIGISESDLDRIFDDFVTLDTSYGRITSGTGLGLGISRRLAQAMGGEIGAESEQGEGSLFWLRLPLPPAAAPAATPDAATDTAPGAASGDLPPPDIALPPMNILVVEDNEINRFLLRRYLDGSGHHVVEAVDGIEGVAQADAARFDVILMDISMPRMDGIEAAQRIRAGSGASRGARILALTAHALPEEQDRFRDAGMQACLTKPISRADLMRALAGDVPVAQDQPGEMPFVDQRSIDELTRQIGPATAAHLLRKLVAEGDEKIALSASLLASGDLAELARQCHQLSGTCGAFGTRRLRGRLADIETAVARTQDATLHGAQHATLGGYVADLPALWHGTRAHLTRVIAALDPAA